MAISHAPAVAIPAPRTRRVARRVLFFGTYDARRYPRVRSRWLVRVLDWLDRAAVHAAHFPCVDTAEHRERVCAAARGRAVVVPVGAPSDWFYPPIQHASERVRVVFFGSFTPLQGAPVIGEALRLLAADERFAFTI